MKMQKNKLMKICVSLLMCLVIMFNVIVKPLEVKAVATEAALCMVLASVCLSLGVSVATGNSNLPGACREIYTNFLSPGAKACVDNAAKHIQNAKTAYMFLYAFERDNWAELTDGIIAYLESNPTTVNHTWVEPVLSSSVSVK